MSQTTDQVRWTTADLELFPDDGNRYEIIEGQLFVTRAPHWKHQKACSRIIFAFESWHQKTGLGEIVPAPGILFSDDNNVIPDVVWASKERLALSLDEAGHLTSAPELIVEVLSAGTENARRDRELKLKLYSERGVQEYWIIDWRKPQLEIYRRAQATLKLVVTLLPNDELSSPLLPGFTYPVSQLFA
jgi:Uma2 family endonuclease